MHRKAHRATHHKKHGKAHHRSHHKAHHTEVLAVTMLFLFSAYVLLLSNTTASATAMATGSVSFAEDSPVTTAGLAAAGTNSYSITLMFVLSLAFLVPVEVWLRKGE